MGHRKDEFPFDLMMNDGNEYKSRSHRHRGDRGVGHKDYERDNQVKHKRESHKTSTHHRKNEGRSHERESRHHKRDGDGRSHERVSRHKRDNLEKYTRDGYEVQKYSKENDKIPADGKFHEVSMDSEEYLKYNGKPKHPKKR